MVKILGFAAAIVVAATSFVAPAYALSLDAAVEQCAMVAAEEGRVESIEANMYRGYCIRATSDYITALRNSGLPADAMGSELAAYVVELTALLTERICQPDSEIAQAIAMTGQASGDPEQAAQIRLISLAVTECSFATTAAIRSPLPPVSISGTPASEN